MITPDDSKALPAGSNPVGILRRRYTAGLASIGLLLLLNSLLIQPALFRLASDPPLINVAGRQRMLSQRLAKAALGLAYAADEPERRLRRTELLDVLARLVSADRRIRAAGRPGSNEPAPSPRIAAELDAMRPVVDRLTEAATRVAADGHESQVGEGLRTLLDAEAEFLPRMERIVGLYEQEARAHVERLRSTGWALTALAVLGLVGIARFVLHPAGVLIGRQIEELGEARAALERRVEQRTLAIEEAGRELAREVERRARAEERHRALLEQFGHAARTTTVGEMASGLAHELNQPLGAAANYAEGCLVALDAPEPDLARVRDVLRKILATTLRAGEIVKRIRRFVTRHVTTPERFAPGRLVGEVEEFFREEAGRRGIAFRAVVAPDLPNLYGDPIQVQQVLVNLVRNAFDALAAQPESPTVVMEARPAASGGVEFAVTDNGEGVPEAQIDRLFDAYFSTRDEGMGMGLAISRTIIEAHHGSFTVESAPGVRTTFRFTLPAANDHDD